MFAPLFLVAAGSLWWPPASGYLTRSTSTIADFVCRGRERHHQVSADYHNWRSARVRVASSPNSPFFSGECVVNVTLATSSEQPQPGRLSQLLLVKIEHLRERQGVNSFYVTMRTTSGETARTSDYCIGADCGPAYLWSSHSMSLYLYVNNVDNRVNVSYEAAFLVTEATNMCGLANRSSELLVQNRGSDEYVFAPAFDHRALPPNNVTCALGEMYALTLRRQSVASDLLNVTVLACPHRNSCGTLQLNGLNCTDGMRVVSSPPGSNVTLRYVSRCNDYNKYAGFVAIARIIGSAEASSLIALTASVVAALAAALAIGITIALLCRRHRRRQRSLGRKPPSSAVYDARSSASAGDQEIAMVGNDLYGVALASRTRADQ